MSATRALCQLYIWTPTAWTQTDFPNKAFCAPTPLFPPTLTFTQASALALCCRHSGHIPCIPVKCGYTVFALHSFADVLSELDSLLLLCCYNPKPQRIFVCVCFHVAFYPLPSLCLSLALQPFPPFISCLIVQPFICWWRAETCCRHVEGRHLCLSWLIVLSLHLSVLFRQ